MALNPRMIHLPLAVRFLAGASCAPYIIGGITWLMGGLGIRLPNYAYWLPLTVISLIFLTFHRRLLLKKLKVAFLKDYSNSEIRLLGNAWLLVLGWAVIRGSSPWLREVNSALRRAIGGYWYGIIIAAVIGIVFGLIYWKRRTIREKLQRLLLLSCDFSERTVGEALETLARFMMPALLLWMAAVYLPKAIAACFSPVIGIDAVQYASEALNYATSMSWEDANNFLGPADGSLLANIHSFLWPAYLANSLCFTWGSSLGYPYDYALSIAFCVTQFFQVLALAAAWRMFSPRTASIAAIAICFFGVTYLVSNNLIATSRDAFRLIPLLFFIVILPGAWRAMMEYGVWRLLILSAFIGFMLMAGHPLNAVPALAIGLAFLADQAMEKKLCLKIVPLYLSIALGAILGGCQIIEAYCLTGKMTGGLIDLDDILSKTPYIANHLAYMAERLKGIGSYWERLVFIFTRDSGLVNMLGLGAGMLFLVRRFRSVGSRAGRDKTYIAFIIVFNLVLLMDFFQWSGYSLTQWLVMNGRYISHLTAISALGGACS